MCKVVAALWLTSALFGVSSAQQGASKPQFVFSAEDEDVSHPAKLPDSVYSALKHDVMHDDSDASAPPRAWFSAERLRPPSPQLDLYLVMAKGELRGANVNEFWLVRCNTQSQEARILWNAAEHDVELRFVPGRLYPDIHTTKMSAVHIWEADFRMTQGHYVLVKSKDEDIQ